MKTVVFWVAVSALAAPAGADLFGTGDTQFTLEFVTISGRTNPAGDYGVVAYDYRISTVEITAEQWQQAGISGGWWSGQQPAASLTWFQAAQFVNWLNINQNRQPAYHFDGETFGLWSAGTERTSSATRTLIIFCRPRTNGSRPPTGTAHHFKRGHRQITRSPSRGLIQITTWHKEFPRGPSAAAVRNSTAHST